MSIKGMPLIFVAVPFLVGLVVCGGAGLAIACAILDWAIERLLRSLNIYREFLAFVNARRGLSDGQEESR